MALVQDPKYCIEDEGGLGLIGYMALSGPEDRATPALNGAPMGN